ncbi:MAG: response regulator [Anaerolineae bacterium]|nr:response regulator [Anaerolineae bacterium]MDQ7034892.1 response regulator [Anaerolineae bacterium]
MSIKILYIEDNANNMRLVRKMLHMHGHSIIEADDGFAGINLALREEPDLILIDIQLASIDGFEVVSRLRTNPLLQHVPIVATTAYAASRDYAYFIASGFDDFLPKPVSREQLMKTITQLCKPAINNS